MIPIAIASLVSTKEIVPNFFHIPAEQRELKGKKRDEYILSKCVDFLGTDMIDGSIRLLSSFKAYDVPIRKACEAFPVNSKFIETFFKTFDRLQRELIKDVPKANWDTAWKELDALFHEDSYCYEEIYSCLSEMYPFQLIHTGGGVYMDGKRQEYQIDSLRLCKDLDKLPKVITPLCTVSFIVQRPGREPERKTIINLAF